MGFDDIEVFRFSIPTITTVSPDKEGIAREAVALLMQRIEQAPSLQAPVERVARHRLVVRESSGG